MERTKTKPEDYLSSLPEPERADMEKLDAEISKIAKGHERVMWEGVFWGGSEQKIIGYGYQTYKRSDKKEVEWFVVGLALQKNYISVMVSVADVKGYLSEQYKDVIGKAKVGRSAISFKKLSDIKLDKLLELIKHAFTQAG